MKLDLRLTVDREIVNLWLHEPLCRNGQVMDWDEWRVQPRL
jgi:hypothetical protein